MWCVVFVVCVGVVGRYKGWGGRGRGREGCVVVCSLVGEGGRAMRV